MRPISILFLAMILLGVSISGPASSDPNVPEQVRISDGVGSLVIGGPAGGLAKAGGDTINLMAGRNDPTNSEGEPLYYGDFENELGEPDWNGWTHYDVTQPTASHWTVSNVNQANPDNLTAWCGEFIAACSAEDPAWGYDNNWHDLIVFQKSVGNISASTTVEVGATIRFDTEPGYDYFYLSNRVTGQIDFNNILTWDGFGEGIAVSGQATYLPGEYINGDQVYICWRFQSDDYYSDGDCLQPTSGAINVDDITVTMTQGTDVQVFVEDFQDNDLGPDWAIAFPNGVGDYANLWKNLQDVDPCATNFSSQVAFIDNGIIVPGTDGTDCVSWCYGPFGYVVNNVGGLSGPSAHLNNVIESPVMDWPDDAYDGIYYTFQVYRHEEFTVVSPGIFYTWGIRSADTDGSAGEVQDITTENWRDREYVYLGGPDYHPDAGDFVTDLMNPGRDVVQVQLAAFELGYLWGVDGVDGTPAPYFDNVRLKVFPFVGPGMSARPLDLAQDNFPEAGNIDLINLGSLYVRFDMANNISPSSHLRNDPGDSIVVDIAPARAGAEFTAPPQLHYVLKTNPVFDPYRIAFPTNGSVDGAVAVRQGFPPAEGSFMFDLPDTGFMFPGDVLHYYISATDAIGGPGGVDPQTALLPADTTGFANGFGGPMDYNTLFVVRALPSIRDDGFGGYVQPGVLFWNDFANRGYDNRWYTALNNNGLVVGNDYDAYHTNGSDSAVGNGLGGRATLETILGYNDMLYSVGNLGYSTISNGDYEVDAGNDCELLTTWLLEPGKDMFLTGDDLVSDLVGNGGTSTLAFSEICLGAGFINKDLRSFIGNQTTPMVVVEGGNPVFFNATSWVAYGGCFGINTFDAVGATGRAQRLAQFTNPLGAPGAYNYAAALLNIMDNGSRVISMPYDFVYIYTEPSDNSQAPQSARAVVLAEVLGYFGVEGDPLNVSTTPATSVFEASHHPNPFNPVTKIVYSMPKAGHLSLKIFNIRGQLVRTMVDGPVGPGEGSVLWDGSDSRGAALPSGLYFYEARVAGSTLVGKMTLLK